ncbi:acetoacetyl-CoA synthetase [Sinorhizobium meliloti]|uniref:AMP-binding enzyme C-terminal domain-containing protein n=1 Tax=Sinorhizobium meliloti (strain SM11) TaxID=707241 RepID=F7XBV1_SINMM|nr:hypothetical protein SM11_pC1465 [Sinorhizobium meliloti SM11]ASP66606.1 hypothetical protein CDO29_18530 [Sinorhizobium meliloti]MBP2470270.1 acetoacetyl-CoA synthetase [Sinorhizobium meliloti]MDE3762931.1 hypothetical protein [Sinorhizobium meliloti]MDE3776619.1 hypothetical protein [Sinorhizobium meliloti]
MRSSLRGLSINSLFETTSYLEFRSSYSDESARIDQVAEPVFDVSQHGGIVIHGRSDATLNPGGVRIGTAEIYSQVEQLHEVAESLCIGQDWDDDIRVILFVLLRDGFDLTEELQAKIKAKIRTGASPRHVPTKIVQVSDIPRTKSGKIVELAVRDVDHGRPVVNKEALANPEALDQFVAMVELSV